MTVEIVTKQEAKKLGIIHNHFLERGHGAFGEPDNSHIDVVFINRKPQHVSEGSMIIFIGSGSNKKVIDVISDYQVSDKMLELLDKEAFDKRKHEKYENYLKLKAEIEADDYYKNEQFKQL